LNPYPSKSSLTTEENARVQALIKPAIVLLVMLRLDRPAGAMEIATLLGMDEHTRQDRDTPGLLIHILESGDPAPPVNSNGHLKGCTCDTPLSQSEQIEVPIPVPSSLTTKRYPLIANR
jgi:hypothetical protein